MALDVYFRDDIARILTALKGARGVSRDLDDLMSEQGIAVEEYYEVGRSHGWHEALKSVAVAFGIASEPSRLAGDTLDRDWIRPIHLRLGSGHRGD